MKERKKNEEAGWERVAKRSGGKPAVPATFDAAAPTGAPATRRILGKVRGARPGPLFIALAGMHGNESAGVRAVERVLDELGDLADVMRGDFVALAGNTRALAAGVRYVERDLNRAWTPHVLRRLEGRNGNPPPAGSEDLDQRELLTAIIGAMQGARGEVFFADLHSTSAEGIPFALPAAGEPSLHFALGLPLPVVTGLVEKINGTLVDHMLAQGCTALAVEAGKDANPHSVENHQAVLWLLLAAAGILPEDRIPDLQHRRDLLRGARQGLPQLVDARLRYAIVPEDRFRMIPGFANIHAVRAGQLLAHDRHGEIRAPGNGYVIMPLYQDLGEDGFFFGLGVVGRV